MHLLPSKTRFRANSKTDENVHAMRDACYSSKDSAEELFEIEQRITRIVKVTG